MRIRLRKKSSLTLLAAGVAALLLFLLSAHVFFAPNEGDAGGATVRDAHSVTTKLNFASLPLLTESIYAANLKQRVLNADKYPEEPQLVLVVQVHDRAEYLKLLIKSLQHTDKVSSFLLIFSHDFFSEEMDAVVQGITFCKVLQIYFPFSTQLYPGEFPGQDPRDCARDMSKNEALKKQCLNAEHPDTYGHYREAFITQTKHHWWWKMHFVWERVQAMQGYSGFVLFLEEDNYMLPDFFDVYELMLKLREQKCPDCDMLALGNHNDLSDFTNLSGKVMTTGWMSTKHNVGMAISKEVYYKLMGCSNEFCTYDDYNWDWTLQHISGTCIPSPLKVLVAQGSRVLHTGDCGLHHKGKCDLKAVSEKVMLDLQMAKHGLYPSSLLLTAEEAAVHKEHMKNGGWGDVRDHKLCNNYAKVL